MKTGGFHCPECFKFNQCSCPTCAAHDTEHRVIKWEDGDTMICAYCGTIADANVFIEVEMSFFKHPQDLEAFRKWYTKTPYKKGSMPYAMLKAYAAGILQGLNRKENHG